MSDRIAPADLARIADAAYAARRSLEEWQPNEEPAPGFRVDHAIAVCEAFEAAPTDWPEDEAGRVIKLMLDLRDAVDGARDADARFGAQQVLQPVQALYVEVDLVQRALEDARVQVERAALAGLRDDPRDRTAMEDTADDLAAQVARVEEPANRVQTSLVEMETKSEIDFTLFSAQFGPIKISVGRLKASLADIKISVRNNEIYRGVTEIANFRLAQALATLELTQDQLLALPSQMPDTAAMMNALHPLLAPLQETTTEGTALRLAIEAAIREHWTERKETDQTIDLIPWHTGMRMLPPQLEELTFKRAELQEVRKFRGSTGSVGALTALSASSFISGDNKGNLIKWNLSDERGNILKKYKQRSIHSLSTLTEERFFISFEDSYASLYDLEESLVTDVDIEFYGESRYSISLSDSIVAVATYHNNVRVYHGNNLEEKFDIKTDDWCGFTFFAGREIVVFGSSAYDPDQAPIDLKISKYDISGATHAISCSEKSALVWSEDAEKDGNSIYFIDAKGGGSAKLLHHDYDEYVSGAAFISNNIVAYTSRDSITIAFLELQYEGALRIITKLHPENGANSICVLPSEDPHLAKLIIGGRNGYIALWEVTLQ